MTEGATRSCLCSFTLQVGGGSSGAGFRGCIKDLVVNKARHWRETVEMSPEGVTAGECPRLAPNCTDCAPCGRLQCENEGECVDLFSEAKCLCRSAFSGPTCNESEREFGSENCCGGVVMLLI